MKRHNLHTHTTYSDGQNTPEELIRKAGTAGLEVIGISDHGFYNQTRHLDEKSLPRYIEFLRLLGKGIPGIEVKIGLEINTARPTGIDPEKLPFDIINQMDYVLFEHVRFDDNLKVIYRNIESVVRAKKYLRIPVGLAHTDIQGEFFGNEEDAVKMLGENDIFMDMPLNPKGDYVRFGYTQKFLEYLRKYKVKFAIGTDVHLRRDCVGNIDAAMKYIARNGLEVIEMVS